VAALRALPAHLRRQAFYKCWTSKEGFLKAKGIGLSGELDEVKICLAASREQARIEANVPGWSLIELNVVADYEGALVYEGPRAAIQLYRWESSLLCFSES
jgi:4'-phosphopantetheinyl transferase